MSGTAKRHWTLEGWDRGETFEAGGFLLQRMHPKTNMESHVFVVGRRAGPAGVHIQRQSGKGHQIVAAIHPQVDPPGDIREAMDLCAEIRRCAAIISRVPIVGGYARDNRIDTFIDFTPIPDEEEAGVRAQVAAVMGIPPDHILGFDK